MRALFLLILLKIYIANAPPLGLLLVTYARNGDYSYVMDFMTRYTQRCYSQVITEIVIVWNNQRMPEQVYQLAMNRSHTVPIYFYFTHHNSLSYRFRRPTQSKAQVYYSIDDDVHINCQALHQTYLTYQKLGNSPPGHIVSNIIRAYRVALKAKIQFDYPGTAGQFFSMGLTVGSLFPKNYLDLFYVQLNQIQVFRKYAQQKTNCEDIYFDAIAQHFYPQLAPFFLQQRGFKQTSPSVGISNNKGHFSTRCQCLVNISQELGYNSLRNYRARSGTYQKNWNFPNFKQIVETRMNGIKSIKMVEEDNRKEIQGFSLKEMSAQNSSQIMFKIANQDQKQGIIKSRRTNIVRFRKTRAGLEVQEPETNKSSIKNQNQNLSAEPNKDEQLKKQQKSNQYVEAAKLNISKVVEPKQEYRISQPTLIKIQHPIPKQTQLNQQQKSSKSSQVTQTQTYTQKTPKPISDLLVKQTKNQNKQNSSSQNHNLRSQLLLFIPSIIFLAAIIIGLLVALWILMNKYMILKRTDQQVNSVNKIMVLESSCKLNVRQGNQQEIRLRSNQHQEN